MTLGAVQRGAEITDKAIRAGVVTLLITDLTKVVAFDVAMADTNYQVIPINNGLAATITTSTKTTSGFTLVMSVGVVGDVGYIAVHN